MGDKRASLYKKHGKRTTEKKQNETAKEKENR